MRKLISIAMLLLVIGWQNSALAATGTVTWVYNTLYNPNTIVATYTEGTLTTGAVGVTEFVAGEIRRVVVLPATSSPASNNPVIYLRDSDGVNILNGVTAVSNAVTSFYPGAVRTDGSGTNAIIPFTVNGSLTCVVSNAGSSRTGEVKIYIGK